MTDEPDDWFERALAEANEQDESDSSRSVDGDGDDGMGSFADRADDDADPDSNPDDPPSTAPTEGPFEPEPHIVDEAAGSDRRDGSPDGPTVDDESLESSTDAEPALDPAASSTPESDEDDGDDGSLFDQSFGDALENAAVPDVDGESDGAGQAGPTLGAGAAPEPDPGGGVPDSSDAVDFGFGGPGEQEFDDDPETALPRIELGVEGLDRMIQGGVPERSLMVAIGSAGTGKTTLGLQFLAHGLAAGERAVFITLEESRQRVIDSATEKGLPFDRYVDEGKLAIVDLDPVEMANSLASIRNELPRLVEEFGATRLVLDSVSLLEMMYEDRAKRRNEVYDFTKGLKEAGVTALLTSEAAEENPYASRHGIVEYLTDAVFVMQYVRPDDFRETRLAIEIQKIRDANHSREKKPYEITDEGISVYQQANLF